MKTLSDMTPEELIEFADKAVSEYMKNSTESTPENILFILDDEEEKDE